MGGLENHNMRPVVKPMDINDIGPPATAPSLIIAENYPHNQNEDQNEPFTAKLPRSAAHQSAQSLKVDSDAIPEGSDAMGVEIGTVAK